MLKKRFRALLLCSTFTAAQVDTVRQYPTTLTSNGGFFRFHYAWLMPDLAASLNFIVTLTNGEKDTPGNYGGTVNHVVQNQNDDLGLRRSVSMRRCDNYKHHWEGRSRR